MSWIAWIVLGGLAGWIASILTKNNARMGIFCNIVVGIIGALLGSWILGLLGIIEPLTFDLIPFLVAVAGAVILLLLFNIIRAISGKKRK